MDLPEQKVGFGACAIDCMRMFAPPILIFHTWTITVKHYTSLFESCQRNEINIPIKGFNRVYSVSN